MMDMRKKSALVRRVLSERVIISRGDLARKLAGQVYAVDLNAIMDDLERAGHVSVSVARPVSSRARPKTTYCLIRPLN
jgi:predicted ArsR family transcriptional regulator